MNLRAQLAKHYINLRGWKTKRKIVVIESDDWGSIRMNSKESFNRLLKNGIPVNKSYFTINDALETNEDLWRLQEALSIVKDVNGRHPIMTLNSVVANPDYFNIIKSNYNTYFYEKITDSYSKNIFDSTKVIQIYLESILKNEFFKPQFHGREHLNVRKFMSNLSSHFQYDILGANENCILGLTMGEQIKSRKLYHNNNYMAGFESLDSDHENEINAITVEGINLFEEIFGYKSKSFVAQSLIWGNHLLPVLKKNNIEYIQGAQQFIPQGQGKLKVINNFSGNKTIYNQTLWRRNVSFEPSSNPNIDWVNRCMNDIEIAFFWNAPSIINTHRVNYIGSINPENRDKNLKLFVELLSKIVARWPDVEFYTSDELGDFMKIK